VHTGGNHCTIRCRKNGSKKDPTCFDGRRENINRPDGQDLYQVKKKGPDRNPARFKIQYPMKNRCEDIGIMENLEIL
jgi:hypothetical protein